MNSAAATDWDPASWRSRVAGQLPAYPDATGAASVMAELRRLPPLVTSWETRPRAELALAQEGNAFAAGRDCAETGRSHFERHKAKISCR